MQKMSAGKERSPQLYTPDQKIRRDKSVWTMVQAVLAPLQFLVCFISIGFVLNYFRNGYFVKFASYKLFSNKFFTKYFCIINITWKLI